ncbi:MAG: radical SAM protein [Oscillospiraceae bacterium]
MCPPDASGGGDGAAAAALAAKKLLRSRLSAAAGAAPLGGPGRRAPYEDYHQVPDGGRVPPGCRDYAGSKFTTSRPPGGSCAWRPPRLQSRRLLLGPRIFPCGNSLLPHPLRLLQLCQLCHLPLRRNGGALPPGFDPGNSRGGPNAGKFRAPGSYTLYRRRHPHHPHGKPAEPAPDVLGRSLDLSGCLEYTVEAGRPDTITQEKLQVLARHGVGRVSINPQSMDDRVLALCGRRHKAIQIPESYRMARQVGFSAINMDLIAGLPGDTPAGFRASLRL